MLAHIEQVVQLERIRRNHNENATCPQTRIRPVAFNAVAFKGERVRVERWNGVAVYLISEEDVRLLGEMEDRALLPPVRRLPDSVPGSG
jgi:hypothetical protein